MAKIYPHIIPNPEDWPINQFGSSRNKFIEELNEYTLDRILFKHKDDIESLLEKSLYLEKQRAKTNPWKVDPSDDKTYWSSLSKEVKDASKRSDKEELHLAILKRIINRYSEEIVGHFNPKTYRFAKRFLTVFFKRLLNTAAGRKHRRFWGNKHQLYERLKVEGYVEEARALFNKGTVVIVPTHFSNLDSIMIGYIVDNITGMPPFSFGAGLNLYDTELIGYFLNRLGAYRVDRRKKNPIYLESLKAMASHSLQKGINNIFFPGGTRSRDGSLESRLKLGLLGSVVESQRIFVERREGEKIFVIPLILGYHYVLEGKFLIEQYLRRAGKERYTRNRDQAKSYTKIFKFIWSLFKEKSDITLSFGEPMDVFGNLVDSNGDSRDKYGNLIDMKDYFLMDGDVQANMQRETVYTKLLGERIVESYQRNNVLLSSHLISFIGFRCLLKFYDEEDVYQVFRMPREEFFVTMKYFRNVIEQAVQIVKEWEKEGKIRLSAAISLETDALIKDGLSHLGQYHLEKPLKKDKKGDLISQNFKLLYFYHNRTNNYNLEKFIDWPEMEKATVEPINI